MVKLPDVKTKKELCFLIEETGLMPLFRSDIPGFSVEDITKWEYWFTGDAERDPWDWRQQIAGEGRIAYGKLFRGKAGFISKAWFPKFANFRRNGYDFDSLYEEGLAPRKQSLVMKLLINGAVLPSYEIKRRSGFGRNGETGFEGVLTALQMRTYIVARGFARKRNKAGEEYGWATGLYSSAEALFGEYARSEYGRSPKQSEQEILEHLRTLFGNVPEQTILRFISL